MVKRFLQFDYTAIKRYGARHWAAFHGQVEFNPNYVVSCSLAETRNLRTNGNAYQVDKPYIVELSNGTKFLTWVHGDVEESIISEAGETANRLVDYDDAVAATKNSINNLI
jgi:hypothetical protein